MSTKTTVRFRSATNSFLSNFYAGAPFEWSGDTWKTAEHAFQAAKTSDTMSYFRIRDAKTPQQAKEIGRTVTMASGWEKRKVSVMLTVLAAKFSPVLQPDMAAWLLATGGKELIYAGDPFWGADALGGRNQLGITLMKVRDLIRARPDFV